jgi:hypothetical protein
MSGALAMYALAVRIPRRFANTRSDTDPGPLGINSDRS